VECCFYCSNVFCDSECFRRFGFFHWYSISGYDSDCPASDLRSRQLLFLLRSNPKNVLFSEHSYHTAMF
jgi:hypothetical protein